jgi:hypothetical protein
MKSGGGDVITRTFCSYLNLLDRVDKRIILEIHH